MKLKGDGIGGFDGVRPVLICDEIREQQVLLVLGIGLYGEGQGTGAASLADTVGVDVHTLRLRPRRAEGVIGEEAIVYAR